MVNCWRFKKCKKWCFFGFLTSENDLGKKYDSARQSVSTAATFGIPQAKSVRAELKKQTDKTKKQR